jgi:hypothetical protein
MPKPLSEDKLMLYIALAGIASVTIGLMLTLPLVDDANGTTIDIVGNVTDNMRPSLEEQEDSSIEVYDRSNNTQISSFDNFTSIMAGFPEVIEDMKKYYSGNNTVTDIIVER